MCGKAGVRNITGAQEKQIKLELERVSTGDVRGGAMSGKIRMQTLFSSFKDAGTNVAGTLITWEKKFKRLKTHLTESL